MQVALPPVPTFVTGQHVQVGNTTFVQLLLEQPLDRELPYTSLDHALSKGSTKITEIGRRAEVNRIHVSHHSKSFLLQLDGEQVVGAKQDRIFNASFLIAPGSEVDVPVSCVERGRWGVEDPDRGAHFDSSETTFVGSARGRKLRRVAYNAMAGRGYDAGQQDVWADVHTYVTSTRVRSRTSAFKDAYRASMVPMGRMLNRLEPAQGKIGVAVVREGRLVGLDVFASPSLYRRVWKKLANGALAEADVAGQPSEGVDVALERVSRAWRVAPLRQQIAPGCGKTLHAVVVHLAFGVLEHDGRVVHLVASEA